MLAAEWVFKLLYYTVIRVVLSHTGLGKWDEILYAQAFITLHNKDENLRKLINVPEKRGFAGGR